MSRHLPANGRYAIGGDLRDTIFIPAVPEQSNDPRRLVLPDLGLEQNRRVEVRFNDEEQELKIDLFWNEPEVERRQINDAIRRGRQRWRRIEYTPHLTINLLRKPPLKLRKRRVMAVVISVESGVYQQPESYLFFRRNKFDRDLSREAQSGGLIVLVKKMKVEDR
jgi:hypothetical protein